MYVAFQHFARGGSGLKDCSPAVERNTSLTAPRSEGTIDLSSRLQRSRRKSRNKKRATDSLAEGSSQSRISRSTISASWFRLETDRETGIPIEHRTGSRHNRWGSSSRVSFKRRRAHRSASFSSFSIISTPPSSSRSSYFALTPSRTPLFDLARSNLACVPSSSASLASSPSLRSSSPTPNP